MPEGFFKASRRLLLPFVVDPQPLAGVCFDAVLEEVQHLFHLGFDIALKFDRVAVMNEVFRVFSSYGSDHDGAAGSLGEEGGQVRGPSFSSKKWKRCSRSWAFLGRRRCLGIFLRAGPSKSLARYGVFRGNHGPAELFTQAERPVVEGFIFDGSCLWQRRACELVPSRKRSFPVGLVAAEKDDAFALLDERCGKLWVFAGCDLGDIFFAVEAGIFKRGDG
jgi:hypothetical protein